MAISLKRVFLLIVMSLILLAGLLGWSLKVMTTPMLHSHPGAITSVRQVALIKPTVNCPPPPYSCW